MKPGLFVIIAETLLCKACSDLANRAIRDCLAGMQYKVLMNADFAHLNGLKLRKGAEIISVCFRK